MRLGDCKAPGAVMDGFGMARRVGHGLISPLGPGAWGHDEVWSRGGKGSRGRIGAKGHAAASVDGPRSGEAQGFILSLIKSRAPARSVHATGRGHVGQEHSHHLPPAHARSSYKHSSATRSRGLISRSGGHGGGGWRWRGLLSSV